jgi:hypothetical protein
MENIVIAAILAAMIHGHMTSDKEHSTVSENPNSEFATKFRTESTPNTVQWVIITNE